MKNAVPEIRYMLRGFLERMAAVCLCAAIWLPVVSEAQAQNISAIDIDISTEQGTNPIYKQEQAIELYVTPNRSVFLYCYYREKDRVYQIFPNRFQSTNYVKAGSTIFIPGKESNFSISFDAKNSVEAFRCFGFDRDIRNDLPAEFRRDLTPLPIPSLIDLHRLLLDLDQTKPIVGMMTVIIE